MTTCALAALAPFTSSCGGGTPAPDSTIAASPPGSDTSLVAVPPAGMDSSRAGEAPLGAGPVRPVDDASLPSQAARGAARPGTAGAQAAADTVRGVVSEVGSYPMTSVVVRPASGGAITVTGALAVEIARAAGAEVWISGDRDARSIAAHAYAVRTVDGEPAVDGTLARDGDRLVLVTASGRRPIARPLQALRGMIGARVWLVGPLDGTITSYGILREP